jgi:hypothetical protein
MKKSILILFLFSFNFCFAQLVVNGGGTAQQIINSFVGSGLTVSNVVLNCGADSAANSAYGTFNGSASNIGLSDGIILTTGSASLAAGPNNSNSAGYCRNFAPMQPDPQLTTIEPNAVYDLCVLEFDVTPHCSSMQVRFVWASEEYPEYVNANVNDAFGFFVTGPAPNCSPGGYNNTNVAVLPNGTPVAIDNINTGNWYCPGPSTGCNNCAYYVDNCSGPTVQYDGFTTPITVTLNVCPCATYHWKFAIADAGDCVWDSGVLIQYLSSCGPPLNYTVSSSNASCSCNGSATVNVTSGSPPYTYLWSPGGQTGQSATGLCAGTYTVSVSDASVCFNAPVVQTLSIGGNSISTAMSSVDILCNGDSSGSASVTALSGIPPFAYSWNTIPVQTTATATNLAAGNYTVTVTDSIGCSVTSTVIVNQPALLTITASSVNASCSTCNDGYAWGIGNGGTAPYNYEWGTNPIQNTDTAYNLLPGSYYVCVDDSNNCKACTTVVVSYSVGIDAINLGASDFLLYPNPAHNTFAISFNGQLTVESGQLKIYDVTGREVYSDKIVHPEKRGTGRTSYIVNQNFSPGLYFIQLRTGEKVYQQKLVVE